MDKELIKEMADLAKTASEVAEGYTQVAAENVSLKAQLAESTEKQAGDASSVPVFTADRLDMTVDSLIKAGVAKEASRDDLLKDLQDDPDKVLDMIEKMASTDQESEEASSFGRVQPVTPNDDSQKEAKDSENFWNRRFNRN